MAGPEKLSEAELGDALETLHAWSVKDDKLHREFRFQDFN